VDIFKFPVFITLPLLCSNNLDDIDVRKCDYFRKNIPKLGIEQEKQIHIEFLIELLSTISKIAYHIDSGVIIHPGSSFYKLTLFVILGSGLCIVIFYLTKRKKPLRRRNSNDEEMSNIISRIRQRV